VNAAARRLWSLETKYDRRIWRATLAAVAYMAFVVVLRAIA